jgi:hypothetical protein
MSFVGPLYVIVEYARYGNLRDFLRDRRPSAGFGEFTPSATGTGTGTGTGTNSERPFFRVATSPMRDSPQPAGPPLTQKTLMSFAYQAARGMEYLSAKMVNAINILQRHFGACALALH